jgi:ParB family chromosome partitioning protein
VVNYLRLLRLPAEIIEFIERGELGMGHARAIAGIPEIQRQVAVARLAVRRNLSARQVEDLARQGGDAVSRETATGVPSGVDRHFKHLQESIGKALGLRVRVMPGRKKNSGRLVIHYGSLEEFDRLSSKLGVSID